MIDLREYAKGAVFSLPLIDITGSQDFEVGMTLAAGDAKMVSNRQGLTNLTCEFAAFTGGDTEPNSGDSITGVTSTETAIVIGVVLTSGSWGAGTAAGTIFVASVSGAWQAEVVNNTTQSDTDSMDLAADFTPSVGIKIIDQQVFFGLTIAEMTCKFADVLIQDQGSDVWIDDAYKIQTYGNASAMHAVNLNDSVRAGLTALPNAAADAGGGLPISDAGGLDIDAKLANTNEITVARMGALTDWINGGRLDLLLDALQTDLDNSTDGLGALKALIDTVNTDLANSTDGLGALKALIDTANTDLANSTDGLGALKALIDTVNSDLANGTDGLGALKTLLDAIPTTTMRGTDNGALASEVTDV